MAAIRSVVSVPRLFDYPGAIVFARLPLHGFRNQPSVPNERIDYHRISRRRPMIIHHFERSSNHSSGSRCGNPAFNGSFEKRSLSQGMRVLFCMFALLLLCSPLIARTQELSATLSGVVTDSSGAVIPHASV